MSHFAMIGQAVVQVFSVSNMLMILMGLVIGMVVGCIPGLSVTLGIILMLPLTYTFDDPATAIILILAMCVYVALIITIGYILASIVVFCFVQFYCGERKPLMYVYVIAAAFVVYFLFKNVFYINLPSGLLPF